MKLPPQLANHKIHQIADTRRAILDNDNKMLAFGQQTANHINWTWIKKSEQD